MHVTFTLRKQDCPSVTLSNVQIPASNTAKYLGLYLDRKLNWKHHIFTKRKALGLQLSKLLFLLKRKSPLTIENKLLIYTNIIKPMWSYGLQLWGTASNCNLEIIQRFQSKTLRMIANAPRYMTNQQIHRDLKVPFVKDEVKVTEV